MELVWFQYLRLTISIKLWRGRGAAERQDDFCLSQTRKNKTPERRQRTAEREKWAKMNIQNPKPLFNTFKEKQKGRNEFI
jgi:hypothetical protein